MYESAGFLNSRCVTEQCEWCCENTENKIIIFLLFDYLEGEFKVAIKGLSNRS
ncbi:hypothetical protein [Hathewaya histolytica]|uniref:hypothetical protein n=1 Tax=Hathewaya histolytica TaxID=1498 RepID=UPI0039F06F81